MSSTSQLCQLINKSDPHLLKEILQKYFEISLPDVMNDNPGKLRDLITSTIQSVDSKAVDGLECWAKTVNYLALMLARDPLRNVLPKELRCDGSSCPGNTHYVFLDQSLYAFSVQPEDFIKRLTYWCMMQRKRIVRHYRWVTYTAPRDGKLNDTDEAVLQFKDCLSEIVQVPSDHIVIDSFNNAKLKDCGLKEEIIYQICMSFNRPSTVRTVIEGGRLAHVTSPGEVSTVFVVYNPGSGHIEVLLEDLHDSEAIAQCVNQNLLISTDSMTKVCPVNYHYKQLARPFEADLGSEPVNWVKVTALSFNSDGSEVRYRIEPKGAERIYDLMSQVSPPDVDTHHVEVTFAQLTLQFNYTQFNRTSLVNIQFSGDKACYIDTNSEHERMVCSRLIKKWGFIK